MPNFKNPTLDNYKLVACMEFIARHVNNEDIFSVWLADGVADGDIPYGHLPVSTYREDEIAWYAERDHLRDLIDTFLYLMKKAYEDGGLVID